MKKFFHKVLGNSNYIKFSKAYHLLKSADVDVAPDAQKQNVAVPSNLVNDQMIICNFCGTIFPKMGPVHSEFLACPYCDSIARERVVFQCILQEICKRTGEFHLFLNKTVELKKYHLLECSPRKNVNKRKIFDQSLGGYISSDYEMKAHVAEVKIDLTDEKDIESFKGAFDIVICAHVLEHIPDYQLALVNLNKLLSPGGFLILQVPVLEQKYTKVTWDEFHGDNTRVFHRFGFDLALDLQKAFNQVTTIIGLIDFQITSPEISTQKYETLLNNKIPFSVLGQDLITYFGLGSPDLCDAFIAWK